MSSLISPHLLVADLRKLLNFRGLRIWVWLFPFVYIWMMLIMTYDQGQLPVVLQPINVAAFAFLNLSNTDVMIAVAFVLSGYILGFEHDKHVLKYLLIYSRSRNQFLVTRIAALVVLMAAIVISVVIFSVLLGCLYLLVSGTPFQPISIETFKAVSGMAALMSLSIFSGICLGLCIGVFAPGVWWISIVIIFFEPTMNLFFNLGEGATYLFTYQLDQIVSFSSVTFSKITFDQLPGLSLDINRAVVLMTLYCLVFLFAMTWRLNAKDFK